MTSGPYQAFFGLSRLPWVGSQPLFDSWVWRSSIRAFSIASWVGRSPDASVIPEPCTAEASIITNIMVSVSTASLWPTCLQPLGYQPLLDAAGSDTLQAFLRKRYSPVVTPLPPRFPQESPSILMSNYYQQRRHSLRHQR